MVLHCADPLDLHTAYDEAREYVDELLARHLQPPAWHTRAACRGRRALFFADDPGPARAICVTCPARRDCIAAALDDPDTAGVWAGTTEAQRARARENGLTIDELLAVEPEERRPQRRIVDEGHAVDLATCVWCKRTYVKTKKTPGSWCSMKCGRAHGRSLTAQARGLTAVVP